MRVSGDRVFVGSTTSGVHVGASACRGSHAEAHGPYVALCSACGEDLLSCDAVCGCRPAAPLTLACLVSDEEDELDCDGARARQDDPTAVLAASNYARKCVAMGPPWVKQNAMTERLEFLYMKEGVEDLMKRSWELKRVERREEERRGGMVVGALPGFPRGAPPSREVWCFPRLDRAGTVGIGGGVSIAGVSPRCSTIQGENVVPHVRGCMCSEDIITEVSAAAVGDAVGVAVAAAAGASAASGSGGAARPALGNAPAAGGKRRPVKQA